MTSSKVSTTTGEPASASRCLAASNFSRWSSSRGPNLKINSGTLVEADIEVRDLPILSLVIPQMRTFLAGVRHFLDPNAPEAAAGS